MPNNTYLKLAIDPTYPKFAAMTAAQRRTLALGIGQGNVAFASVPNINHPIGVGGGMVRDPRSLWIGVNPLEIPLDLWPQLNVRATQEIAQLVQKGAVIATIVNRGSAFGSVGDIIGWHTAGGLVLNVDEVRDYRVGMRRLWSAIDDNQVITDIDGSGTDLNNIEQFLYIPRLNYTGTQVFFEIDPKTVAGVGPLTVQIWGWSSHGEDAGSGHIYLILENTAVSKSNRTVITLSEIYSDPYVIPLVTAGLAGGDDVDIYAGFTLARIG